MEEAIVKLLKVAADKMSALYQYGCDGETVVDNILNTAELAVHPESRQELVDYFRSLN